MNGVEHRGLRRPQTCVRKIRFRLLLECDHALPTHAGKRIAPAVTPLAP
jgi:hypothetical protein